MINVNKFIKELQLKHEVQKVSYELCYMEIDNFISSLDSKDVLPADLQKLNYCRDYIKDMILHQAMLNSGLTYSSFQFKWVTLEEEIQLKKELGFNC